MFGAYVEIEIEIRPTNNNIAKTTDGRTMYFAQFSLMSNTLTDEHITCSQCTSKGNVFQLFFLAYNA